MESTGYNGWFISERDSIVDRRQRSECGFRQVKIQWLLMNNSISDFIMRNALSMPLQQIGELATHVSDNMISDHHEIPWKQIKGMRSWFAHQYWDMSIDKTWYTLTMDVPQLKDQLRKIIEKEQDIVKGIKNQ